MKKSCMVTVKHGRTMLTETGSSTAGTLEPSDPKMRCSSLSHCERLAWKHGYLSIVQDSVARTARSVLASRLWETLLRTVFRGRSDLTCPLTQIVSPGGQRGT